MTQLPIVSNDAHALQQRRFWNRQPMLSAAIWFGGAALVASAVLAWWFPSLSRNGMGIVGIAVSSGFCCGALLGRRIGIDGSATELSAVKEGAAVVLASHVLMAVSWAVLSLAVIIFENRLQDFGSGLSSVGSLVFAMIVTPVITGIGGGWVTFPVGIIAALGLLHLRTAPPRQPKVLGCGQHSDAS